MVLEFHMITKLRSLKNNQGFIKYFKNTSWLFAEKILRIIAGLFVGIWIARYLGPDKFGLLSYAQSFVGLFSIIAVLGLDGLLVRELVKYPEKEEDLLGTAFVLRLFGTVLTWVIIYIAICFTSNDSYTNILIFIVASSIFFQSFNVIDRYFQAKVMSRYTAYTNSLTLLISSIVKVILILSKAPLIYFVYVIVLDSIVLAINYIYFYYKIKKKFLKISFDFNLAKKFLKDSWPLILSGMAMAIYLKIDQVMIKNMIGNNAIGNYAAAVKLSEAWYFIPVVILTSIFPAIMKAKQIGKELYYKRLQNLYNLMVVISVTIALFITIFGSWLIVFLFGYQYIEASYVLTIHVWSGVFFSLSAASGKFLLAENYQIFSFIRYLIGAVVNIALNLILIPCCGIKGAAIATLISIAISGFLIDFFSSKMRKTAFMKLKALSLLFIFNSIKRGYYEK